MRTVHLPRTLDELWSIRDRDPEAAIYAGGTDLLVKVRSGAVDPPSLICLERVTELSEIRVNDGRLFVGAGATHSRIIAHPLVSRWVPVLTKALCALGSPPIRHMGTIGGNIVTASPAGDSLPPLYILDAEVELRSSTRTRRMAIRDFILGPGMVAMEKGEILGGVWLNIADDWTIQHYEKVGKRKAQACTVVSLAALLRLSPAGPVEQARLAWGGVGPTVVTLPQVEEALVGKRLSVEVLADVSTRIAEGVSPIDDVRASADYRRQVAAGLLVRLADMAPRGETQ